LPPDDTQVGYRRDQYRRCANLLEAVAQLMEHFEAHKGLPKIATLTRRLETVQKGLQEVRVALAGDVRGRRLRRQMQAVAVSLAQCRRKRLSLGCPAHPTTH
jgi:hypothetical protein